VPHNSTRQRREFNAAHGIEHTHGYAKLKGYWVCVADYYSPRSTGGCGEIWADENGRPLIVGAMGDPQFK